MSHKARRPRPAARRPGAETTLGGMGGKLGRAERAASGVNLGISGLASTSAGADWEKSTQMSSRDVATGCFQPPQQRLPCFGVQRLPRPLTDVPFDGNFLMRVPQSWLRETAAPLWVGCCSSRWQPRALQSGRAWKWSQVRGFTPPRNSPRLQAELSPVPDSLAGAWIGGFDFGARRQHPMGEGPRVAACPVGRLRPRLPKSAIPPKGPSACTRHRRDSCERTRDVGSRGNGAGPRRAGASLPRRRRWGDLGAFLECSENLGQPRVEGLSRLKGCAFPRYRGRPDFVGTRFSCGACGL